MYAQLVDNFGEKYMCLRNVYIAIGIGYLLVPGKKGNN